MARVPGAKTEAETTRDGWHTARKVAAGVLFAAAAACLLYGAWLGLRMHLSKTMPGWAFGHALICAMAAAALYTISVRIEPLPQRRKRRGKRWMNVEMPTLQQIWATAPGDFVEAIFAAIGMMAVPAMLFIGFGSVVSYGEVPDLVIAVAIGGGAFALQGAFVSWRGRRMFDPPGQVRNEVRAARAEAEPAQPRRPGTGI